MSWVWSVRVLAESVHKLLFFGFRGGKSRLQVGGESRVPDVVAQWEPPHWVAVDRFCRIPSDCIAMLCEGFERLPPLDWSTTMYKMYLMGLLW